MEERLIGALIGLARATDGNEHLINPSATELIIDALSGNGNAEHLIQRVEEEKKKMVPDCFLCANPCGRTDAFDLNRLQEEDEITRQLKRRILTGISHLAKSEFADEKERLFYKALIVIGIEAVRTEILCDIVNEIEKAAGLSEMTE